MDSGKLLLAIGVSLIMREKRKKSSDDAATDRDFGAFVLRGYVAWPDHVKSINSGNLQLASGVKPQRKKTKKSSHDAATNGYPGGSVFQADVAWPDHVKDDR